VLSIIEQVLYCTYCIRVWLHCIRVFYLLFYVAGFSVFSAQICLSYVSSYFLGLKWCVCMCVCVCVCVYVCHGIYLQLIKVSIIESTCFPNACLLQKRFSHHVSLVSINLETFHSLSLSYNMGIFEKYSPLKNQTYRMCHWGLSDVSSWLVLGYTFLARQMLFLSQAIKSGGTWCPFGHLKLILITKSRCCPVSLLYS
jgi:hypothetical protein